jgi:hypothetical protein
LRALLAATTDPTDWVNLIFDNRLSLYVVPIGDSIVLARFDNPTPNILEVRNPDNGGAAVIEIRFHHSTVR